MSLSELVFSIYNKDRVECLSVWYIFIFFADFALAVPSELESVLRLKTVDYFVTRRPWLGMSHAATMDMLVLVFFSNVSMRLFQIFMELT